MFALNYYGRTFFHLLFELDKAQQFFYSFFIKAILIFLENFNKLQSLQSLFKKLALLYIKYIYIRAMTNRLTRNNCEELQKKVSCDSTAKNTYLYPTKSHIQISVTDKKKPCFLNMNRKQEFVKNKANLNQDRIDKKHIQSINKKTNIVIFKKNTFNKITEKIKNFQSHRIQYFDHKNNEKVVSQDDFQQKSQSNIQKNRLICLYESLETKSQISKKDAGETLRNSCYLDKSTIRETLKTEPKKKISLISYGHRRDTKNKKCYSFSNRADKYQIKATKCQNLSLLSLILTKKQLQSKRLMQPNLTRLIINNSHLSNKTLENTLKGIKKKKVRHQQHIIQNNECQINVKGIRIPIDSYELNQRMNQ